MYICYADESGFAGIAFSAAQRYLVMVGILTNTYNMHRTQSDFAEIVGEFKRLTGREFEEVKAEALYAGRRAWGSVPADRRCDAYEATLRWFVGRKHDVLFSAIDAKEFFQRSGHDDQPLVNSLRAPYIASALHIALMVQRRNKGQGGNKGKTLLIFDQQVDLDKTVSEFISKPPTWTDHYYSYVRGDRLDQIIDTAYFVRSHHASLIQVADLISFVLRRHAEIHDGGDRERYGGEKSRIASWVDIVRPRLIEPRHLLPKSDDKLVKLYRDLMPGSLKAFLR